ncbi:hypothetical protein DCMF_25870 [Candidatus Formimonas warabiya]|uniref:Methyltransferase type 12 domain-containing protein n=2 Tax=Formimonas warabiya TaxID=1761012 RepID=A0A3G1KZ00_FORW1|nr:hypothetical protein DCMF_25870 [Candidatus Formimonas warabiya]
MYNNFKHYLGNRILDIGSGTGTFVEKFLKKNSLVMGTDIFENQVEFMKQRFKDFPNFTCLLVDIEKSDISFLKEYKFDTITCINVLEHLSDDLEALKKFVTIFNKEGTIIILVPAMPFLFSDMDRACGHFRRYKKGMIAEKAMKIGLKVLEDKYMNCLGIVPYYIKSKSTNKGTFSDSLGNVDSRLYNLFSSLLEPMEKLIKPPLGISEIIILKK